MDYKLLSKIFYSDTKSYESEYLNRISSQSAIIFDFSIHDNTAFIVITPEISNQMYEIAKLDKKLTLITNDLPDVALEQYIKRCLIDEIILTNEIEGVVSTRKDVFDALTARENPIKNNNIRLFGLVKRYSKLTENESIRIKTCQDIRDIYNDIALSEVINDDLQKVLDGIYFRSNGVDVLSQYGKVIHCGIAPEDKLNEAMSCALDILNDSNINILLRIAVFHYLFGYIHPFYDGNGRTSRFISSYLLSRNFNILTGFRLAYTIKENINSYYKSFRLVNDKKNKGDMTPFVIIFFDIIIQSFNILIDSLSKKFEQLKYCYDLSKKLFSGEEKCGQVAFGIIQNTIFGAESVSINEIIKYSGETKYTVNKTIKRLKEMDMLSITKSGNKYLYNFNIDKFN